MSRHLLTVADMTAGRGIEVSTLTRRLADAKATHAATGKWPTQVIPRPVPVPEGSRVYYIPAGGLRIGVVKMDGLVHDGPVWDSRLKSVEAWLTLGHSNSRPFGLESPAWLRAEYNLPPAGKGRSLASLAAELGVHRDTVRRHLTRHQIPVRSTGPRSTVTRAQVDAAWREHGSREAAAVTLGVSRGTVERMLREPPGMTVPMPRRPRRPRAPKTRVSTGRPGGHPVDRPALVARAREVLESGRYEPGSLAGQILQARIAMPDATWEAIAASLGRSTASVTATWSKATKPRKKRRQTVS